MPDENAQRITPYLMIRGASKALDFYTRAFGAKVEERYDDPDGERVGHATLSLNGAHVYVSDEYPELDTVATQSPRALGGTTAAITLNVDDADAWWARATNAGAEVVKPLKNEFYGRTGTLRDPFGHVWGIHQPPAK